MLHPFRQRDVDIGHMMHRAILCLPFGERQLSRTLACVTGPQPRIPQDRVEQRIARRFRSSYQACISARLGQLHPLRIGGAHDRVEHGTVEQGRLRGSDSRLALLPLHQLHIPSN